MTYSPVIGQLYIVRTRGEYRVDGTVEKSTLVLQASSPEEIHAKLRHIVDQSKYLHYSVTHIEKIKPRFHVLRTTLIPREDVIAFELQRKQAAMGSGEAQRTNQGNPQDGKRKVFAFGIAGRVKGEDDLECMRKVGKWLLAMGLDKEQGSAGFSSPLLDGGKLLVEEEGPTDSTVTSASMMNRMDATHFRDQRPISAGLPSLGRR